MIGNRPSFLKQRTSLFLKIYYIIHGIPSTPIRGEGVCIKDVSFNWLPTYHLSVIFLANICPQLYFLSTVCLFSCLYVQCVHFTVVVLYFKCFSDISWHWGAIVTAMKEFWGSKDWYRPLYNNLLFSSMPKVEHLYKNMTTFLYWKMDQCLFCSLS